MPDIRGNEGVNFGGKRGVNVSDPINNKDAVNLRTLRSVLASFSGNPSTTGTSFVTISSIGDGYPVYAGLNAEEYQFRSFSAGTPNLQMYCGDTITYSLNDNINVQNITATTVDSNLYLSAGTPIEFLIKEKIWSGSGGSNSTIRNNYTGNLAIAQSSFAGGTNNKSYGIYASIFNGNSNVANGGYSLILNGSGNNLQVFSQFSTILNGIINTVQPNSYFTTISNGVGNNIQSFSSYSSIFNGKYNSLIGFNSTIIGSNNSYLTGNYSAILGGLATNVTGNYSVVLGGFGISTTASNTTSVPYLRIANLPTGGSYMLTVDNSGYVFKQTIPSSGGGTGYISGATNIGGTHGVFSNISAGIFRFKSLSGGSNIIITSSSTENAIALSSNVVINSISATTISGGTFYSGQTPLGQLLLSESSRYWTGSTGTKSIIANNQTGNIASGTNALVAGRNNKSYGTESTIIGGRYITLYDNYSFAGSGYNLKGKSKFNFIGSGKFNAIYTNSLYGSVINGRGNKLTGHSATIINGYGNVINIPYVGIPQYLVGATIAGGRLNSILFKGQSFIGSGSYNQISGNTSFRSFIGAGSNNIVYGLRSFIGTGYGNKVFAPASSIVSAVNSKVYGSESSIISARASIISGTSSGRNIILGGSSHNLIGNYSLIGIGANNNIKNSNHAIIFGGFSNTAETNSTFSLIAQGKLNKLSQSTYSFVLNGYSNTGSTNSFISVGNGLYNTVNSSTKSNVLNGVRNSMTTASFSSVLNGSGNTAISSSLSSVVNGKSNYVSGSYTSILNGFLNTAIGAKSVVLNGIGNTSSGNFSIVGNGSGNTSSGNYSTILNGHGHSTNSSFALIGNGKQHRFINAGYGSIVNGSGNTIQNGSTFSFIGTGKLNTAYGNYTIVVGGKSNSSTGNYALVVNGSGNTAITPRSTIINGKSNRISNTANYASIVSGKYNFIFANNNGFIGAGSTNTIIGGFFVTGQYNSILNGSGNYMSYGSNNSILNGTGNTVTVGKWGSILAGVNNLLYIATASTIVAGISNTINGVSGTSILAGSNITATSNDTAYAKNLSVLANTYLLGFIGGGTQYLTVDNTGLVGVSAGTGGGGGGGSTTNNGINTFTAGTSSFQSVNITALTINTLISSGSSVFTGGLSANTLYSGTTNLYSIFAPLGTVSGGASTYVQPGLNTYTGGTSTNPTVNVSALTINTISASGDSRFTTLSATTFTANTITATTVSANTLYVYGSLNQTQQTYLSTVFSTTGSSLTDVTGMSFTIQPFEVWQFQISGQMSGSTANGQNHGLSIPTGAILRANDVSNTNSVTAFRTSLLNSNNSESSTVCALANNVMGFEIRGIVSGSSTSGSIQLRLRANTAGNTESIQDGAYLIAQRIR